ncbi:MAG: elongation factor G [Geothrix sp.]|uniref:elongation factor G n=1 Tax=Geothrix sp. TaxID=1962974 RepID=UPI0018045788|nr:elongation factor G [Geothrix sp.]NWJ42318.1 elongation factor G [Geothrix sp.]WIL19714.1 MAG: elongation factor G [Geothrix sp.]
MSGNSQSTPRVAAIVGPYLSGKTSLMESLLFVAGALPRKGSVKEGNTVGDASMEAKARQMSVEASLATCEYQGEAWTLIDCPGSVEFRQEAVHALMAADIAVVVCDPDPARALMAAPALKFLDDHRIPHVLFINKMEAPGSAGKLKDVLNALQVVSERPLVLVEIPIREGDQITGYVDLISEHAYKYEAGKDADLVQLPDSVVPEEQEARQALLEKLADFDDHLMEELLSDLVPPEEEVSEDLAKDVREDLLVPVYFGSADKDTGVRRLLQALCDEAPRVEATAARLGIPEGKDTLVQVFKTVHAQHVGKLSISRVWRGEVADGSSLAGNRVSGINKLFGAQQIKQQKATVGEVVALGRMDEVHTSEGLTPNAKVELAWPEPLQPMLALSLHTTKSGDDVKLSLALQRLCEEDASLKVEQNAETQERILWGQGEVHLKCALDRLKSRFGLDVLHHPPMVPYRETFTKAAKVHGRHKHQTGGHGQFGDVWLEIKPRQRGEGFEFEEKIVGGVVPKNFFGAVEHGVVDWMKRGPLGFPVVDIYVALVDGSYHTVDSSDMAFKTAARIGMNEAAPVCNPVLLEPISEVHISVPSEFTPKAQRLVTGRRGGQVLGFDAKPGWKGWDIVSAYIPQAEMSDVVVELRSLTMGVGSFTWAFHHLQELVGRDADKVVEARKATKAPA